jgi:cell division protein DivIC
VQKLVNRNSFGNFETGYGNLAQGLTKMGETSWKKKLFLILVFIESSFLLFWGAKSYYQVRQAQNQVSKVEEELNQLRLENKTLMQQAENMKDPFYLEKMAREKLGLAKKGEIIYKILPPREKK